MWVSYYSNYLASFTTCQWLNASILLDRLMKIWLSKPPGQLHTEWQLGAESELQQPPPQQPPWSDTRPYNYAFLLRHVLRSVIKLTKNTPKSYLGQRTCGRGPSFPSTSDLRRRDKCGEECPTEPDPGTRDLPGDSGHPSCAHKCLKGKGG